MPLNDVEVTNTLTDLELISYLHTKEFNIKENRFEQDKKNPALIHVPYGSVLFRTPSDSSEIAGFKKCLQGCELRSLGRRSCDSMASIRAGQPPLAGCACGMGGRCVSPSCVMQMRDTLMSRTIICHLRISKHLDCINRVFFM